MYFIIIKPESTNDVLGSFAANLHNSFLNNGVESIIIDGTKSIELNHLIYITNLNKNKKCVIVSFNGALGDIYIGANNINFLSSLNCLNIAWMVDDVVYHYNRLKNSSNNKIIICTSKNHWNSLDSMGSSAVNLLGLAGTSSNSINLKPFKERDFDIIIPASWMGEPLNFWEKIDDTTTKKIVLDCIEILKLSNDLNYFSAFNSACINNNINPTFDSSFFNAISLIQNYIRSYERKKIIFDFIFSNKKIGLIGSGWNKLFCSYKNIVFLNDVKHSDIKNHYSNSKFVLNFNSENGSCERLFDALSVGCGVITASNDILKKYFSYLNGVVFYDRTINSSAVNNFIYAYNDINFEYNIKLGYEYVLKNHTWDNRAISLVNYFSSNLLEF